MCLPSTPHLRAKGTASWPARVRSAPRAGYESKIASWGATTRCASHTWTACRTSFFRSDRRMLPEARRSRITREGDARHAGKGGAGAPLRAGRASACRTGPPAGACSVRPGAGLRSCGLPKEMMTRQKKKSRPSGGATLLKNRAVRERLCSPGRAGREKFRPPRDPRETLTPACGSRASERDPDLLPSYRRGGQ